MRIVGKINRKNLRRFCHVAGFGGVSHLCRELGISRQTAYEAVSEPRKFPSAYPRILRALNGQN
jgi:hypothetical protein